jgi:biotin transport system substrate-specific component
MRVPQAIIAKEHSSFMATSTRTFADLVFPRPQAQRGGLLRDALLVLGGAVAVTELAQVSDHQVPVPHTAQTLGVLLVGAALGWRRGSLALVTYVLAGIAGLPVFANGTGGAATLAGPTGGYLVGFILAAALVGFLAERGWDRTPWLMALAMVLGNLVIYALGVAWLMAAFHLSLADAYLGGVKPFLVFDALKLVVAVIVLPGAWFIAGRGKVRG